MVAFRGTTTSHFATRSCRTCTTVENPSVTRSDSAKPDQCRRFDSYACRHKCALLRHQPKRSSIVESIIRYRPQARLAETLLKLVESHGSETPDGWEISIPLDSAGLAGMVGASTATVRRLLHDLQADGVIGTRKQHYLVHKPEELQRRTPRREA